MASDLTTLQRGLLEAFFARTEAFFLTGGAALTGFYLHHRTTEDLDLFAPSGVDLKEGSRALRAAAEDLGAEVRALRDSPDFLRLAVQGSESTTIVDLVIDRVPQLVADKNVIGQVRVDPLREIAANKLCALLGRSEVRDLLDLRALLAEGLELEAVLADAHTKDGGADAATLAWVLSTFAIPPGVAALLGVEATHLEAFREALVDRLTRLALPAEP